MKEPQFKIEMKNLAKEFGLDHINLSIDPRKNLPFEEQLKESRVFLEAYERGDIKPELLFKV